MDQIENYINNTLSAAERADFEQALKTDPALAEAVAFYVQAQQAAQAEARARRKAELDQLGTQMSRARQRTTFYTYATAASVILCLGLGYWLLTQDPRPKAQDKAWATTYIEKNFSTLTTKMGSGGDSIQIGISAYNTGNLEKSQAIFNDLLQRDSLNAEVQKYSGIVSLRRGDYDQAIKHFHRLGTRTDLMSNPGKFYEALALLQQNLPLNKSKAENLLKEVKAAKLEGWKEVEY